MAEAWIECIERGKERGERERERETNRDGI